MHALLVPFGSSGDVHPILGLGRALRARGHRVSAAVVDHFAPLAERLGFETIRIGGGEEYRGTVDDPDLWHPTRGIGVVMRSVSRSIRPVCEAVAGHADPARTVVVAGTLALGARVAEDALGLASVTVHLQPTSIRSVHEMPALVPGLGFVARLPRPARRWFYRLADSAIIDPKIAPAVNAERRRLGLGPARGIIGDYAHSPRRVLALFPPWYAAPQPDWPGQVRQAGFPLYDEADVSPMPPDLDAFLAAGPPPVVATFGSAMKHAGPLLAAAAEGIRRAGRRGVLLTKFDEQVPRALPPGVVHAAYAPFSALLPRSAAIVHHGGIGTTAQALAAGIPQVITPLAFDQFDNAGRLRRLGVAAVAPRPEGRPDAVAHALGRVLGDPVVANRCRGIADRMRAEHPVDDACRVVEEAAPTAG